jgi:hypothetical protein
VARLGKAWQGFHDDHLHPASVTIVTLGYRARCTEPGCHNLARLILRYAADGSRPMTNSEFCRGHTRARIAQAARLKVFDNRRVGDTLHSLH